MNHYFSPCPRGLESCLVQELQQLGAQSIQSTAGGVKFRGGDELVYTVNLHSRIASRVLIEMTQGYYASEDDLYEMAYQQPWGEWFPADYTLRIDVTARHCPLVSLNFVTLRIKDGICDHFRQATGIRPSIDTERPDVRIFIYLEDDHAIFYMDTSGEALFKRGWRLDKGDAPLRENLAAGILMLSQWQPDQQPLYDPMCGSGTFILEAALMATRTPPGIKRPFGFQRLHGYNQEEWLAIKAQASEAILPSLPQPLLGSDLSNIVLASAEHNLERCTLSAELKQAIQFKQVEALKVKPISNVAGLMVLNPPYGERIELEQGDLAAEDYWYQFSGRLKDHFSGWHVNILTTDMKLQQKICMKPRQRIPLMNGNLDCRLYLFDIQARRNID
jgi:putative N6-adenine-specific DNA methylase